MSDPPTISQNPCYRLSDGINEISATYLCLRIPISRVVGIGMHVKTGDHSVWIRYHLSIVRVLSVSVASFSVHRTPHSDGVYDAADLGKHRVRQGRERRLHCGGRTVEFCDE